MRLFVALLLLPLVGFGQSIDSDAFLGLAGEDSTLREGPSASPIRLPWVNSYEFRTETRDFDLSEQEYTLRVSPASARIRRAQRQFSKTLASKPDFKSQEVLCDNRQELYRDWVELYVLMTRNDLLDSIIATAGDEQLVYQRMLAVDNFNPERFLALTKDLSNYKIAKAEVAAELSRLMNKYSIGEFSLDYDDLIAPSEMLRVIAAQAFDTNPVTPDLAEAEYERIEVEQEMAIEVAEKNQYVDFAQIRYQGPTSDALRERVSVGVGIQLNTEGSHALKMQELRRELIEIDREVSRKEDEAKEVLMREQGDLVSLITAYQEFNKIYKEEQSTISNIIELAIKNSKATPLLLLSASSNDLQRQLQSLDRQQDVLRQYVRVLSENGMLCSRADINYLKQP